MYPSYEFCKIIPPKRTSFGRTRQRRVSGLVDYGKAILHMNWDNTTADERPAAAKEDAAGTRWQLNERHLPSVESVANR
jgi:hypothetical protein